MLCTSCRQPVALAGVFPGGTIVCPGCGHPVEVAATAVVTGDSPYRRAAEAPPPSSAAGPDPRVRPRAEPPAGLGACPRCATVDLDPRGDDLLCSRCGGLFVWHARLAALVDAHRSSGRRPPAPSGPPSHTFEGPAVTYLSCPFCTDAMGRKNFGGRSAILVDVCAVHGVWFDRGELDSVIAFAFDLPEDATARAALLGLVWQALPPAPRATTAYTRAPLETLVLRDALSEPGVTAVGIVSWLARWLT